jgi:hypothetical protein
VPRTTLPPLLAVVCCVAVVAVAGCGADSEGGGGPDADTQVRSVVARFGVATRTRDYQTICDDLLADDLVNKIEAIGLPCESALSRGLGEVKNPTLAINEVSIAGNRALVSIHTTASGQPASDDALQLIRETNRWKIASLAAPKAGQTTTPTTTTPTTTATTPTTTTGTATTKTTSTTKSSSKKKSQSKKTSTTKKKSG